MHDKLTGGEYSHIKLPTFMSDVNESKSVINSSFYRRQPLPQASRTWLYC